MNNKAVERSPSPNSKSTCCESDRNAVIIRSSEILTLWRLDEFLATCYYVPGGLDCSLPPGTLPLTPPRLLSVVLAVTRFRHACTLGASLRSDAGLLPRAKGHKEREHKLKNKIDNRIKTIFIQRSESEETKSIRTLLFYHYRHYWHD